MFRISPKILSVSVNDDNLDLFEGQYPLTMGMSYNSYIIDDEQIAIVDAVDIRRCDEWLGQVDEALNGRQPSYLIVQHVEPDHSGSVAKALERYPGMKVVCTAKAVGMLEDFFPGSGVTARSITVKEGDTLSLGTIVLQFFMAPMVHWPEVMMTYDSTDGILFSADAFGTFSPTVPEGDWDFEARRYYCNIVGKYGNCVQAVLKKLGGLDIKTICPLHGYPLTDTVGHCVGLYDKWSRYEPETRGVLVAYASVYGGTAAAARQLARDLEDAGAGEVVLMDLARHDVSYAVAMAFRLSAMALCSVTYDASLFPAMHNFLHHLQLKNFCNRTVGLVENGSWAPVAAKLMRDELGRMKGMTIVDPVVTLHSRLHPGDDESLRQLAHSIAEVNKL